jgi:cytochrome c
MKKVLLTMMIAAGLYACGGGESTESTEPKPISNATVEEAAPAEAPVVAKKDGKALIEASDCLTCHKVDSKVIGPAYQEVAKKYENNEANVKMLAQKIINGGQGNWGDIQMQAHKDISEEDASAMVEYILSLKK